MFCVFCLNIVKPDVEKIHNWDPILYVDQVV